VHSDPSFRPEFPVACGLVNAKNEYGGYTGYRRFVFGDGRVILEKRDNVVDARTGACL